MKLRKMNKSGNIVLAIVLGLVVMFIGGFVYVILMYPWMQIEEAVFPLVNGTADGLQVTTLLHNTWYWIPIIAIFAPVIIYILTWAMKRGSDSYTYEV